MSYLRGIVDQMQPVLDAAKKDPNVIPNYRVMKGVHDRIMANHNYGSRYVTQFVMAMKFDVTNDDDVDVAIEFMYSGFELVCMIANRLAGKSCPEGILEACRGLEVKAS